MKRTLMVLFALTTCALFANNGVVVTEQELKNIPRNDFRAKFQDNFYEPS